MKKSDLAQHDYRPGLEQRTHRDLIPVPTGQRLAGNFLSTIGSLGAFAVYGISFVITASLIFRRSLDEDRTFFYEHVGILLLLTLFSLFFLVMDFFGELIAGKIIFSKERSPLNLFCVDLLWESFLSQGIAILAASLFFSFFVGAFACAPVVALGLAALLISRVLFLSTHLIDQNYRKAAS